MKINQVLVESAGATVAFAFGRFNPAHQGHIEVWRAVEEAGANWFIGTNPSTLGPNDPLTFQQKSAWMEEIYPPITGHIVPEQSVLTLAAYIFKKTRKNESATVAYITDAADWAWSGKLLNQYNGVEGAHGYYKFAQIIHVPSPRVSSATALRDAARADDKVAFYHASGTDPKSKVAGLTYFDTVKQAVEKYPLPVKKVKKVKEQGVAEAGFPGAPDVEMPPMKPSGDPQRDKLKQEYMDLHREIKSLVDIPYSSNASPEQKMQAKARIKQLNDRADQIKAILEPRQPPNEWQKKTYGYDDNWNIVKKGVAENNLKEFAPGNGGGESGRWYTDDQLTDLVGDGWWNDLDISGDISKQEMIQEAQAWLDDQGYNVHVLNCKVNDDNMEWYIEGSFHNPGFAKKGMAEGSVTPDVTVNKVHDDGHEKEWHIYRGKEMIGYVTKNQPDTAEGLYIAYGHGPGRAFVEEFTGLKPAVNYIASLKEGIAEDSLGLKKLHDALWTVISEQTIDEETINEIDPGMIANLYSVFPTVAKIIVSNALNKASKEAKETSLMIGVMKKHANNQPVTPEENEAMKTQFKDIVSYGLSAVAGVLTGAVAGPAAGVGVALAGAYKKELLALLQTKGPEVLIGLLKSKGKLDVVDILSAKLLGKHALPFYAPAKLATESEQKTVAKTWDQMTPKEKSSGVKGRTVWNEKTKKYYTVFDVPATVKEDEEAGEVEKTGQLIPFPAGTTKVSVSDVYDWYKLGQVISDLDDANPADFGQGAPETVIAFGSEEEENKLLPLLQRLGLKLKDIDQPVGEAYHAGSLYEMLKKERTKNWSLTNKRTQ